MTRTVRTVRTTTSNAHQSIANLSPFTRSGALSGRTPDGQQFGPWDSGRLPREYIDSSNRSTYVVFSYATPIAWVTGGGWLIPSARYSVTMSRHQSAARHGAHLSGLGIGSAVAA